MKALDVVNMTDDELMAAINKIKSENLEGSNNLFIKGLLTK